MRLIALTTGRLRVADSWPGGPAREAFKVKADGYVRGHHRLALAAVAEGWDESVVVVQDDVALHARPEHSGTICAYAARTASHVCPWAFTATLAGWAALETAWRPPDGLAPWQGGYVCHAWRPDVVWRPGIAEHRRIA